MQASDIIIPLPFVIVLGGMAWWITSAKKRGHQARGRLAELNGWQYEAGSGVYKIGDDKEQANILYRVSGSLSDGKSWRMEVRMRMEVDQTGMSESTVWQMPSGDMTVLLMQRSSVPVSTEMKTAVLRKNGINIDVGKLHTVEIASLSTASDPYEVYADEREKARARLNPVTPFIAYFSRAKARPSVCMTPGNTAVRLPLCLEKPADMEALIRLGLALCS